MIERPKIIATNYENVYSTDLYKKFQQQQQYLNGFKSNAGFLNKDLIDFQAQVNQSRKDFENKDSKIIEKTFNYPLKIQKALDGLNYINDSLNNENKDRKVTKN